HAHHRYLHSFPTRRSSDLIRNETHIDGDYLLRSDVNAQEKSIRLVYGGRSIPDSVKMAVIAKSKGYGIKGASITIQQGFSIEDRSEEHTSELQSRENLVCR